MLRLLGLEDILMLMNLETLMSLLVKTWRLIGSFFQEILGNSLQVLRALVHQSECVLCHQSMQF